MIPVAPLVYQQTEPRVLRHLSATARTVYGDQIEDVNSETPDKGGSTGLRAKELANAPTRVPRLTRVARSSTGLELYLPAE